MSLSIHSTPPAAAAANLAPAPAVKSTSDTTSAALSQKQASSQAAVTPSAPKDTVQISTAAQTALQESKESQAQTAKEAAHGDRQAVKLLAKETSSKQFGPSPQEVSCADPRDSLDGVNGSYLSQAIQQSHLSAAIFYSQAAFAIGEQKSLPVDRLQPFPKCQQR